MGLVGESFEEAEAARELRPRLAVRAERCGLPARRGRQAHDGVGVAGFGCVVRERRQVGVRLGRALERRQHGTVQRTTARHRHGPQHRLARQLVPEAQLALDLLEQAGGQARVDRGVARPEAGEQAGPDDAPDDAGRLDGAPRLVVEAREARGDRVADARGQTPTAGRHHLGHEEGVPGGEAVELLGVDVEPFGQPRDRRARQRRDLQAGDARRGREVAEDDAQRVPRADLVVAVRREDQRARPPDPAAEEAEQVEGRLVGPVDVLEDRDGGPLPERLEQEREDPIARAGIAEQRRERRPELRRHVDERPERARGAHGVAAADEHPRGARHVLAEAAHQRRLADARLPADEHHGTGPDAAALRRARRAASWSWRSRSRSGGTCAHATGDGGAPRA